MRMNGLNCSSPTCATLPSNIGVGGADHAFDDVLVGDGVALLDLGAQIDLELPLVLQHLLEAGQVPLLLDALGRHVGAHHVGHRARAQVGDLLDHRARLEDLVALLVDHLALVVGDVVVLEQLLADVEVARLDLALRVSRSSA